MASLDERLMQWLRDAHAMEEQAETSLAAQARRLENYPDLRTRIERHLEETRGHAATLAAAIERRGGGTSGVKDMTGKTVATFQNLVTMFAGDEVMKGCLANYTLEHMEIASYKILIATAELAGDIQTRAACEHILAEEIAMADWLDQNLEQITRLYLRREELVPDLAKK
jgi:ferritin-like metal-binding protein YciE